MQNYLSNDSTSNTVMCAKMTDLKLAGVSAVTHFFLTNCSIRHFNFTASEQSTRDGQAQTDGFTTAEKTSLFAHKSYHLKLSCIQTLQSLWN